MSMMRTVGANPGAVATAGSKVPCWNPGVLTATSFVISKGLATIVMANTFTAGQIVSLYGFTTATYFNGLTLQVQNPTPTQFSFPTTHADVGSTGDAGKVVPSPGERYRAIRIEVDQSAAAGKLFVGDLNVSSTQYAACLSLTGQIAFVNSGEAIDPTRIFIDTDTSGTKFQTSLWE
jgi:hypothetical protein